MSKLVLQLVECFPVMTLVQEINKGLIFWAPVFKTALGTDLSQPQPVLKETITSTSGYLAFRQLLAVHSAKKKSQNSVSCIGNQINRKTTEISNLHYICGHMLPNVWYFELGAQAVLSGLTQKGLTPQVGRQIAHLTTQGNRVHEIKSIRFVLQLRH